ncbi:MAG: asparaginase [Frankiaceae bacterium]
MTVRIALLAAGGTIACTLDGEGYAVKTLAAADLAATFPAPRGVELVTVDYGQLSSWNITTGQMLDLARTVDGLLEQHDGVVVTYGTDTLEETAAFLSFAVRSPRPVVVTGAMRNMSMPGADGPANLLAATLVAADPGAAGRGALVVLADEAHRAVEVTKRHSNHPATFGAPSGGPVGWIELGRVLWRGPAGGRTTYAVERADMDVPLVVAAAGMGPAVVERAVEGCAGVVVAGFGLGHVPAAWLPPLAGAVTRGVPVVLTSRTHAGPTGALYRGDGGGVSVRDSGIIQAGYRTPYAARIELICALGAGLDLDDVRAAFAAPLP